MVRAHPGARLGHHHRSKPRREEALLTTTPPSSASPPLRAARRFRGCNPNLLAIEEPCQTAGATSWTSDWAAPALLVPLLPAFLAGAAAALLTLHLNASPGPLTRFGRTTVSALGRLVGFAAIVGGCWGARFVYADAMAAAQRDARSLVRLRTQHLGWYVALAASASVVAAGAVAALFGRGAALGPSSAQIRRDRREARLMRAMTPDLVPYQVGVAASGTRVMRSARALDASDAHRAAAESLFRRELLSSDDSEGEEESGEDARAGAGRRGGRGRGGVGARAARAAEAPVVSEGGGGRGASFFRGANFTFWGANLRRSAGPSGGGGAAVEGPVPRDRGGVRESAEDAAYRSERERRLDRLAGTLGKKSFAG